MARGQTQRIAACVMIVAATLVLPVAAAEKKDGVEVLSLNNGARTEAPSVYPIIGGTLVPCFE